MPSIRPGDHPTYTTIKAGPWYAKTLAEGMQEAAQLGGQWLVCDHLDAYPTYNGGLVGTPTNVPVIGQASVIGPSPVPVAGDRGSDPPRGFFEYGTPRANVSSYTMTLDREGQATKIYVPRTGFPEAGYSGTQSTLTATDTAVETAYGRLEAWVDPNGIEDSTIRQNLANLHLSLRKSPRRRIVFTPSINNIAQPFVDYNVYDWIQFRAFAGDQTTPRIDVYMRIFGIDVSIDDAGNESVTLNTFEDA